MQHLTIELVKLKWQQLKSIGWKTPKDGDRRRTFYALDERGKALVLTLQPAMPDFYPPGANADLNSEWFPEALCVEIARGVAAVNPACWPLCEKEAESHRR
jgi:hypothetical protein